MAAKSSHKINIDTYKQHTEKSIKMQNIDTNRLPVFSKVNIIIVRYKLACVTLWLPDRRAVKLPADTGPSACSSAGRWCRAAGWLCSTDEATASCLPHHCRESKLSITNIWILYVLYVWCYIVNTDWLCILYGSVLLFSWYYTKIIETPLKVYGWGTELV